MSILLLSPLPPPSGGIARWTERYLSWCEGKNHVDVINTALIGERAGEAGVEKKLTDEFRRAASIIRETGKKLRDKPEVMHLNTSCSKLGVIRDYLCVRKAVKKKVPIVTHCHCNIEDQLRNGRISQNLFKYIVNVSASVLVLNQSSKEYVEKINADNVCLFPNFVMEDLITNGHVLRNGIRRILYVGDVRLSKGSDDVYELASLLSDKEFIIVGSVTEEMKSLNKPENVFLLGRLEADDVYQQMDQADIFLFPSLSEGFSNAVLEAMARGLPIIATDVGANKEMIESGGGIIVSIHDVYGMKAAIRKMESPDVRREMSNWNLQKVKKSYEYNIVMRKLMSIYREL